MTAPHSVAWGDYEPAIRRWEPVLGCPAPPPAEPVPAAGDRYRHTGCCVNRPRARLDAPTRAQPALPAPWPGDDGGCRHDRLLRASGQGRPAALAGQVLAMIAARPGRYGTGVRQNLTPCAESSVDAGGPGWQARRTCPPVRYPASAEVGGRSAPGAAARDLRSCRCHPRMPGRVAWPDAPGVRPPGSGRRRRPW